MSKLMETLGDINRRYQELDELFADPAIATDPTRLQEIGRERAELEEIVSTYNEYAASELAMADAELLAGDSDPEMASMAAEEMRALKEQQSMLMGRIKTLLVPKDPSDAKNVIVEVRAGTGGDEAALFAADLFRMYARYAERQRWKV